MELPLPANQLEFEKTYSDEAACREVLFRARWPDGFRCPRCGHDRGHQLRCRPQIQCAACRHQISLTAGTLFHSAKLPLFVLFRLLYMLIREKSGTNMCRISRQLGVSRRSVIVWVQKIRGALQWRDARKLNGTVEVDEMILGGRCEGHPGRRLGEHQVLVVILCEERGSGPGRARLEVVPHASREMLTAVIRQNVEPGSEIRTDGWTAYSKLEEQGYRHDTRSMKGNRRRAHVELPRVHLIASLVKRYVDGLLHGSWWRPWLQSLLDEWVFRFNRRRSGSRVLLFNRVLEVAGKRRPPTRAAMALAWRALG